MNYWEKSIQEHKKHKGKLAVVSKVPLDTKDDLSIYYTPWVAEPCLQIAKDPKLAYDYTWKNNSVAVVSDGSAVLWLGNIGWLAGLPVMEGKAILFKKFADVDAVPIILNTQDPEEIIQTVKNISPTFGGINLEDIKAPNCFYIEEKLKKDLDIPVFHDDQHGTAIVVLAGIINSLKLVNKDISKVKIVMTGAWAAGIACANLLINYWAKNLIMLDSKGPLHTQREWLNKYKQQLVKYNTNDEKGSLQDVLKWADVFIWVSQPNLFDAEAVKTMSDKAIIFAMANPNPEINPDEAKKWWAYIIATGRSDFPNQINNVIAFPWIFRGVLDARLPQIEEKHKIAAAEALANYVTNISPENIIPSPLTPNIWDIVAKAVQQA